jgi:phage protein D/phage baseplate assembly protein gpV
MPGINEIASQVAIKINDTDVQPEIMDKLANVTVDQHTHLPDMFTLRFYDSDLQLMDSGPFDLTKRVEISAAKADNSQVTLIKGEITALEPDFGENMTPEFVVRGYDPTHRLFRETRTRTFLNVKDSDLAQQIGSATGLQTEIETTSTVYEHVFQSNQSDLDFLMQRAWRIGFECFVADNKLYFRKPSNAGAASITLEWGSDLKYFRPRMTLAEQVDEVIVRGWDVTKKEAIVGKAESGSLYPSIEESKDGKTWASSFGRGKKIVVEQPVISQAEANVLASARLDEISGAFIDAEGMATRRPDIKAGQKVKLENLGQRFSGEYLVTNATHVFSPEGLKTIFRVTGSRTGLLSEQVNQQVPVDLWNGVVVGVVTNSDDPNNMGRVKLKFPWLSDDAESNWSRIASVGAGPGCGFFVVPQVGDEVLVAFEHGDFNYPVILGGLWNGQDKPPEDGTGAGSGEKPLVRVIQSPNGHKIIMYDDAEKKIEIITTDGRSITLSDKDRKIIVKTSNVDMTIDDSDLKIKGVNISIEADAQIKIKASAGIDIESSAVTNIKGSVINLN